jgi:hypothetical protein
MNMNLTDIANQLCGSYRPDRWMRQRKWWWAFFIWLIGVAGVNAYKIYKVLYDKEMQRRRRGFLHGGHMQGLWKNSFMISFSPADRRTMWSSIQSQRATWTCQQEWKHRINLLICCVWTGKRL